MGNAEDWHKKLRPGLESEFRLCLEQTLHRIQRYPESYPLVTKNIRRTLLPRFPYMASSIVPNPLSFVLSRFCIPATTRPNGMNAGIEVGIT